MLPRDPVRGGVVEQLCHGPTFVEEGAHIAFQFDEGQSTLQNSQRLCDITLGLQG